MKTFKEFVYQEDVSIGGGALGPAAAAGHGGAVGNSDWYAPGDARIPKALGAKKVKGKKTKVLVQRRNIVNT
jgi:hypothetical protein